MEVKCLHLIKLSSIKFSEVIPKREKTHFIYSSWRMNLVIFSCVLFENPIYELTKNLFFLILSEELQEEFLELKIDSVAKGNPTGIT